MLEEYKFRITRTYDSKSALSWKHLEHSGLHWRRNSYWTLWYVCSCALHVKI